MNEEDAIKVTVGIIMTILILVVTGAIPSHQLKKDRQEAIAHGAAHWTVNTNGETSFEWNQK